MHCRIQLHLENANYVVHGFRLLNRCHVECSLAPARGTAHPDIPMVDPNSSNLEGVNFQGQFTPFTTGRALGGPLSP